MDAWILVALVLGATSLAFYFGGKYAKRKQFEQVEKNRAELNKKLAQEIAKFGERREWLGKLSEKIDKAETKEELEQAYEEVARLFN